METGFSTVGANEDVVKQLAAIKSALLEQYRDQLSDPQVIDLINNKLQAAIDAISASELARETPNDSGLLSLTGLGGSSNTALRDARLPPPLPSYDEEITSERVLAIADLYYHYQMERLGIFRAILKLQELFKAGQVRLASGPGALKLYQFDRQKILRFTKKERFQAYRRVFGYTKAANIPGSRPNAQFHRLFTNFIDEVVQFFRDQRVSNVIQEKESRRTLGSVAVVRRSGLDLRNNLKGTSYGHVNVLRVELQQLLEQAFEILGAEDVMRLFGADSAWDVVEEVLRRYLNETAISSQRSRMAITGRNIIYWLAQPDILSKDRTEFEALINAIREDAEEWWISAKSASDLAIPAKPASSNIIPLRPRRQSLTA